MLRDVFIITESPNRWIEFKNPGTLESVIDKFVAAVERGGNTSLDAAERSLARVREDLELSRDNTDNANKKLYGRLALGTDEIEAIELALQTVGDDDDRAKIESDLAGVMDKNDHVFGEAISLSPEEQENVNQTVRRLRGIIDAMMDEKIDPKKGLEWIKQLWQGAYDDGIYDQVIDMTGDRFDSFEKEYMRGTDFESMSDPGAGSMTPTVNGRAQSTKPPKRKRVISFEGISGNGGEGLGGHGEGFEVQNKGVTRRWPGEGPKVNGGRSQPQELDSYDQPQYESVSMKDVFEASERLVDPDTFEYMGHGDRPNIGKSPEPSKQKESPVLAKYASSESDLSNLAQTARALGDEIKKLGEIPNNEFNDLTRELFTARERKIDRAVKDLNMNQFLHGSQSKSKETSEKKYSDAIYRSYSELWADYIPLAHKFLEEYKQDAIGKSHPSGRWIEMEAFGGVQPSDSIETQDSHVGIDDGVNEIDDKGKYSTWMWLPTQKDVDTYKKDREARKLVKSSEEEKSEHPWLSKMDATHVARDHMKNENISKLKEFFVHEAIDYQQRPGMGSQASRHPFPQADLENHVGEFIVFDQFSAPFLDKKIPFGMISAENIKSATFTKQLECPWGHVAFEVMADGTIELRADNADSSG